MIGPLRIGAAASVVDLSAAKEVLNIDFSDKDLEISGLVAAATETVSNMTGLILGAEQWCFSVGPQTGKLRIPVIPVRFITEVTFIDRDGDEQSDDAANYTLIPDDDRPYMLPSPGNSWPDVIRQDNAIKVTIQAGLVTLPPPLRVAILHMVVHLFTNRGDTGANMPHTVENLIGQYRRGWVAA